MTAATTSTAASAAAKFLLDPYLDWTKREGIPIYEDISLDLLTADTAPWPRLGDRCAGAFVHHPSRGDWMTIFLLDLPPGGASAPQRHLYDEMFYVLSGTGSLTVELTDGREQTIGWGPRSLFAPPLNARYRITNGSGREPARLACANDLRILMNIYHDEAFFFDNPFAFPEREGARGRSNGKAAPALDNLRDFSLVSDLGAVAIEPSNAARRTQFLIGESSMGAQLCEIPAGHAETARNDAGLHILCVQGEGHTLLGYEGDRDPRRVDWRPGTCFALGEQMIHQHVASGDQPARHLAIGFGTNRYPIVHARRLSLTEPASG